MKVCPEDFFGLLLGPSHPEGRPETDHLWGRGAKQLIIIIMLAPR